MKFLKVLLNSLLTGLFFCYLVALLTWDLNINLDFVWQEFAWFALYLVPTYGMVVLLLSIIFFFMIQFFSDRPFKIAVISPSFLMISFTLFSNNYIYTADFHNYLSLSILIAMLNSFYYSRQFYRGCISVINCCTDVFIYPFPHSDFNCLFDKIRTWN